MMYNYFWLREGFYLNNYLKSNHNFINGTRVLGPIWCNNFLIDLISVSKLTLFLIGYLNWLEVRTFVSRIWKLSDVKKI